MTVFPKISFLIIFPWPLPYSIISFPKDIFGNTIIEDDKGNRTTIKKDIFGNEIIEYGNGHGKIIKKDIFGNTVIEEY